MFLFYYGLAPDLRIAPLIDWNQSNWVLGKRGGAAGAGAGTRRGRHVAGARVPRHVLGLRAARGGVVTLGRATGMRGPGC
jgi:hypothetical protein